MGWTTEQVLSFAPDDGTAKRGKSTAKLNKWQVLEKNDRAFWGECKGSGSRPYLTGVDLNGPAFKCSCPVRKPPCKHVIGLMLLAVEFDKDFAESPSPNWMNDWLVKRDERLARPKAPIPEASVLIQKAIDGENRRVINNLEIMKSGLNDFEIWLKDLIRQGIASVEKESYSFWKDAAARLVDSKARNAAYRLESIPLLINANPNWFEDVLKEFADIYLLIQGINRIEKVSKPTKYDILLATGHTISKNNLFLLNEVTDKYTFNDQWAVLGKIQMPHSVNNNLKIQRYWLKSTTNEDQFALIYEPKFVNDGFDYNLPVGMIIQAELVYYPSNFPQRAHIKKQVPEMSYLSEYQGHGDLQAFFKAISTQVAANPWTSEFPCLLNEVTPMMQEDQLFLIDKNNETIPVQNRDLIGWKLLALSGGMPIALFGEWTGRQLVPLSAWIGGRFIDMPIKNL